MKRQRFPVMLSTRERRALLNLADEDGLSSSAVVRRLIRREARQCGLWPLAETGGASGTESRVTYPAQADQRQ